jgi:lipopolysaccharide/colanic/teichoic acid biosynthesis glycosyltransferase
LFVKRLFDVVAGSFLVVLTAPLMVAIAAAIVWDSGRPVFYRQERVGLHGKHFSILKFRTLRNDTPTGIAAATELDTGGGHLRNPHIGEHTTPVGRFLRKSSLNELPQLMQVVTGKMSLVGPRPMMPEHARLIGDALEERCSVRPGLTGRAQVNGRKDIPLEEFVAHDLDYVRSRTFWHDVAILLRTPLAVISGHGAH